MNKIILLVDDSPISRVMLQALIEDNFAGIEVKEAGTAEQALAVCEQSQVDAVFLDENMPGEDGLTVAPKLLALCPDVKIALLTANFQERIKIKAQELGLAFYTKPITLEKVKEFIAANLGVSD